MSDFTFFGENPADQINMVISTLPGRGTFALLQQELTAKGSDFVVVDARFQAADLVLPTSDGTSLLAKDLEFADTIVVDDASRMLPSLAELVQELVQERSLRGTALPALKNVVLVYASLEGPDTINMNSRFETVRITV